MVQMKVSSLIDNKDNNQNFISHMVQMKEQAQKNTSQHPKPLYPTWFR